VDPALHHLDEEREIRKAKNGEEDDAEDQVVDLCDPEPRAVPPFASRRHRQSPFYRQRSSDRTSGGGGQRQLGKNWLLALYEWAMPFRMVSP
jgi:hypothetical protein